MSALQRVDLCPLAARRGLVRQISARSSGSISICERSRQSGIVTVRCSYSPDYPPQPPQQPYYPPSQPSPPSDHQQQQYYHPDFQQQQQYYHPSQPSPPSTYQQQQYYHPSQPSPPSDFQQQQQYYQPSTPSQQQQQYYQPSSTPSQQQQQQYYQPSSTPSQQQQQYYQPSQEQQYYQQSSPSLQQQQYYQQSSPSQQQYYHPPSPSNFQQQQPSAEPDFNDISGLSDLSDLPTDSRFVPTFSRVARRGFAKKYELFPGGPIDTEDGQDGSAPHVPEEIMDLPKGPTHKEMIAARRHYLKRQARRGLLPPSRPIRKRFPLDDSL